MGFFLVRNTSPLLIFNTAKRKQSHTFNGILLSRVMKINLVNIVINIHLVEISLAIYNIMITPNGVVEY